MITTYYTDGLLISATLQSFKWYQRFYSSSKPRLSVHFSPQRFLHFRVLAGVLLDRNHGPVHNMYPVFRTATPINKSGKI